MRGKLILLLLALLSIVAAVAGSPSPAAGNVTQSATGSGQLEFTTDGVTALRTFAFEATKASDGSVSGEAQIDNRSVPGRLHIQIDCLNVVGNDAVMSGTITSSTKRASRLVPARSSACRTTAKVPAALPTGSPSSSRTQHSSAPTSPRAMSASSRTSLWIWRQETSKSTRRRSGTREWVDDYAARKEARMR